MCYLINTFFFFFLTSYNANTELKKIGKYKICNNIEMRKRCLLIAFE